jgi:hypothetical protein
MARHKCFISYHKADQAEVTKFIQDFSKDDQVFISRAVSEMNDNIVNSTDDDYVMRRIRELYLTDSTVTIVLVGKCTWARKYVDWEVMSSLRNDTNNKRSGLLAITLPSVANSSSKKLPDRVDDNVSGTNGDEGYARWKKYPTSSQALESWIEDAFNARTNRASLVKNGRARRVNNGSCP